MIKKFFFILFILSMTMNVYAVKIKNLYQALLPVSSQLSDAREDAVRNGLLGVLVKLTGDPDIENNTVIKEVLSKADYYVQEFSYLPVSTESENYQLKIKYESNDIKKLLKSASIPYWDEKRPLILIWLAFTNVQSNTEIIGNENPNTLLPLVKMQGKQFGLPIIFPMMDVSDLSKVNVEDVINNQVEVLKAVGKRYASDAFLVGHINATTDSFYASEWKLMIGDHSWEWTLSDHELPNLIHSIMYQISQTLLTRYSNVKKINEALLKLKVIHVGQKNDLNNLVKFLSTLTTVQKIELAEVSGDNVNLTIILNSSKNDFEENLLNGQKMLVKADNSSNNELIYEWKHD